jgi:hypothetical protein
LLVLVAWLWLVVVMILLLSRVVATTAAEAEVRW